MSCVSSTRQLVSNRTRKLMRSVIYMQKRTFSTSTESLLTPPYTLSLKDAKSLSQLIGASGTYMIISNSKSSSFYVGSSVNLARRIGEYLDITKGVRSPGTSFERGLAMSTADNWTVMILCMVPKHLILVEEQLAICNYNPPLNVNHKVKFNYWLPGFDLPDAIRLATDYRNLFPGDSVNYDRFTHLIDSFNSVLSVKEVVDVDLEGGNMGKPVFVYDYNSTNILGLYSSINYAITALKVSQDTIYTSSSKQVVYTQPDGQILAISLTALTSSEVKGYIDTAKPTQTEYSVVLKDSEGNVMEVSQSLRDFSRTHGISLRTFRRKLDNGLKEFKGLQLSLVPKSRRIAVYCYDPDTRLRIAHYASMTAAFKALKVRFYTLQEVVQSNSVYKGVLYSYSDTYPFEDNS